MPLPERPRSADPSAKGPPNDPNYGGAGATLTDLTGLNRPAPTLFQQVSDQAMHDMLDGWPAMAPENAAPVNADLLAAANVADARFIFLAIANGFEAGQIIAQANALNPTFRVYAERKGLAALALCCLPAAKQPVGDAAEHAARDRREPEQPKLADRPVTDE